MANIQSAKKRARQAVVRHAHNISILSRTRTFMKGALAAISTLEKEKTDETRQNALEKVREAMKTIDKMVPKGIFHKNKAARLKSRLNAKHKKVLLG